MIEISETERFCFTDSRLIYLTLYISYRFRSYKKWKRQENVHDFEKLQTLTSPLRLFLGGSQILIILKILNFLILEGEGAYEV